MNMPERDLVVRPAVANAVLGLLGLGVGGVVLAVLPGQIGAPGIAQAIDPSGPGFFPILASLLSIGAGLWCLLDALRPDPKGAPERLALRRSAWVMALLAVCGIGLHVAGMLLALGATTAGLAVVFGERRPAVLLALGILTPLGIHLLFERSLKILLPGGWVF